MSLGAWVFKGRESLQLRWLLSPLAWKQVCICICIYIFHVVSRSLGRPPCPVWEGRRAIGQFSALSGSSHELHMVGYRLHLLQTFIIWTFESPNEDHCDRTPTFCPVRLVTHLSLFVLQSVFSFFWISLFQSIKAPKVTDYVCALSAPLPLWSSLPLTFSSFIKFNFFKNIYLRSKFLHFHLPSIASSLCLELSRSLFMTLPFLFLPYLRPFL